MASVWRRHDGAQSTAASSKAFLRRPAPHNDKLLGNMRISKIRPACAAAAACMALSLAGSSSAQKLELKVLSGRPDMVSGGNALGQISGTSLDVLKVRLNGYPTPSTFRPGRTAGTLLGRVEGLNPGTNLLQVSGDQGTQKLVLINHPIGGPVFSGPHQQPFICQTEFSGLEKAVDADCNAPTRVQYFYRSTQRVTPEETKERPQRGGWVPDTCR